MPAFTESVVEAAERDFLRPKLISGKLCVKYAENSLALATP